MTATFVFWMSDGPIEVPKSVKSICHIGRAYTWRDPPRLDRTLGIWTKIKRVPDRLNPGTGCTTVLVGFDPIASTWSKRFYDEALRASQAPE